MSKEQLIRVIKPQWVNNNCFPVLSFATASLFRANMGFPVWRTVVECEVKLTFHVVTYLVYGFMSLVMIIASSPDTFPLFSRSTYLLIDPSSRVIFEEAHINKGLHKVQICDLSPDIMLYLRLMLEIGWLCSWLVSRALSSARKRAEVSLLPQAQNSREADKQIDANSYTSPRLENSCTIKSSLQAALGAFHS